MRRGCSVVCATLGFGSSHEACQRHTRSILRAGVGSRRESDVTWGGFCRRSAMMVSMAIFAVSCSASESPAATDGGADEPSSTTVESTAATDTSSPTAEPTDTDAAAPDTASSTIPPDGVIAAVPCPANSICAAEFWLNGRIYAASCGLIDPTQVDLDNQLGGGWALGRELEAYSLVLDPSHGIVAISTRPGSTGCGENLGPDAPTSPWKFAFGPVGSYDESLVCEVGLFTPGELAQEGCWGAGPPAP